ncbi:MAG: hypothetical protein DMG67_11470 [Acidobacteria bacterium]|nr:MAG: hypothetical protein DMG67_11470 [Acidobacteriota bacterium]
MDRAAVVCTGTLDVSGHANCQTNQFAVGIHTVTAVYAGDTNFVGSALQNAAHTDREWPWRRSRKCGLYRPTQPDVSADIPHDIRSAETGGSRTVGAKVAIYYGLPGHLAP